MSEKAPQSKRKPFLGVALATALSMAPVATPAEAGDRDTRRVIGAVLGIVREADRCNDRAQSVNIRNQSLEAEFRRIPGELSLRVQEINLNARTEEMRARERLSGEPLYLELESIELKRIQAIYRAEASAERRVQRLRAQYQGNLSTLC